MGSRTPVYGHSRGYRMLATVCVLAVLVFVAYATHASRPVVPIVGGVLFSAIGLAAGVGSVRRVPVMLIEAEGFAIVDPAIPIGIVRYDEVESIRIYATLAQPVVALRLKDASAVRRRSPVVLRFVLAPVWAPRHYQIVLQLSDGIDDQVSAITSVALRHRIPVTSELV